MNDIERLEIAEIEKPLEEIKPLLGDGNLDLIREVNVRLEVRVGDSEMTVNELLNLGRGSVVRLSRTITTPVDVLIDGKVIARGHLVAADDNFGVQVTELCQ
jgi:flagellar motor switch protein FliN/FliY